MAVGIHWNELTFLKATNEGNRPISFFNRAYFSKCVFIAYLYVLREARLPYRVPTQKENDN